MKKYKTIYADPPWFEHGSGNVKCGADKHYPLMKTNEIINLNVEKITDNNSHLYLWVTNNHLIDGLDVMEAWGFRYVTKITWGKIIGFLEFGFPKIQTGLGQYFQGSSEDCLFGVKGRLPYKIIDGKKQMGKTLIIAPRKEHSRKPQEMRKMIEKVSYEPRIELFAREKSEGWDVWGNEVESDIEL